MIRVFFEYDGAVIQMPVNPQELEIKGNGANKTKEIVSLGEINLLNPEKLKEITLKSFLPAEVAPYVVTKGSFKEPEFYISFFSKIIKAKKPVLFIVTDTDIYMSMAIESFSYKRRYGTSDIDYELKLKEFKNYTAKSVNVTLTSNKANVIKTTTNSSGSSGATSQDITIGCTVRVNGRLHRDSYGSGPGVTEVNATRLVNFIVKGRACPYHVTLLGGGWRGWVTADSVVRL